MVHEVVCKVVNGQWLTYKEYKTISHQGSKTQWEKNNAQERLKVYTLFKGKDLQC